MFLSFKCNKRLVIITIVCVVVVAVLCVLDAVLSKPKGEDTAAVSSAAVNVQAANDEERAAFLAQFGWQVCTVPLEVEEVTIPEEFDKVYQNYNDLQRSQGFDLAGYSGQRVKRWTYEVTNYPDGVKGVRANLLVCDDKVIGGDICTLSANGFMHGFNLTGTGMTKLAQSVVSSGQ